MNERDKAIALANRVLDKPYIDPDGDIALLARQFLRAIEWQPIATAPKDGTRILVTDIDNPQVMTVVSWARGEWKYENPHGAVSHWTPLPVPPK